MRLDDPPSTLHKNAEGFGCTTVTSNQVIEKNMLCEIMKTTVLEMRYGMSVVEDAQVRPDGYSAALEKRNKHRAQYTCDVGSDILTVHAYGLDGALTQLNLKVAESVDRLSVQQSMCLEVWQLNMALPKPELEFVFQNTIAFKSLRFHQSHQTSWQIRPADSLFMQLLDVCTTSGRTSCSLTT